MGSVGNTVSYCCIWKKGGRVLYTYKSEGDHHEIANLASSCLEMTPLYHRWYFQTTGKHTFGFLIDSGYVYFTIVHESLGNSHVLRFLQKLRDEFGRVDKRGSTKTVSSLDSLCLQEQLFPVVLRLVASLEHHVKEEWPKSSNGNSTHVDDGVNSSTEAPLLGKPSKQEKKKMKDDHVVVAIEMEEHRRSTDGGIKIGHGASSSSSSQLTRINKPTSQNLHRKWCRQVWIVLAIDAAVCVVLFIIWLIVCHGTECIR